MAIDKLRPLEVKTWPVKSFFFEQDVVDEGHNQNSQEDETNNDMQSFALFAPAGAIHVGHGRNMDFRCLWHLREDFSMTFDILFSHCDVFDFL